MGRRALGLVAGLSLALASLPAGAFTPEADPMQEAQSLHERAQAKFETFEYEGAIELWTQAYEILPDTAATESIRNAVVYNLASARIKQFELDGETGHLKKAKLLLSRYLQEFEALHGDGDDLQRERTTVDAKIAEIDERLNATAPASSGGGTEALAEPAKKKRARKKPKPGTYLLSFGAAAVGLGVGAMSLGISGAAKGRRLQKEGEDPTTPAEDLSQIETDGRRANARAIGFSAGAAALLGAGVAMIVVGHKKRASVGTSAVFLSPTFAGVTWTAAF